MVVSAGHFKDVTNGYERRTDGLWVHRGALLVDDVRRRDASGGWIPFSGWNGGWAPYADTSWLCGYRKLPDGTVRLRGLMAGGTALGTHAFGLPAGFRPYGSVMFACVNAGGVARIDVRSDGLVVPATQQAGAFNNTFQSLNEISYLAES